MNEWTVQIAKEFLEDNPDIIEDARQYATLGNSIAGSLLNLFHGVPRPVAEDAVLTALDQLDRERAQSS